MEGRILDQKDNAALIGVNVLLKLTADTTKHYGVSTDLDGAFRIEQVIAGTYILEISYLGYRTKRQELEVNGPLIIPPIDMSEDSKLLKEVVVEDKQIRVQQLGDTAQYNAGAFKTNKDAAAEELLSKMPGITNENGTIKAQGEQVQKVLIDGKPFYGDDPNLALKNLPAEVIDKIQVFDQLSEQSQFTGFNDGNTQKTLNIITKNGISQSKFGKVYGGYGYDNVYNAGGNFNIFKGDRRFSILGMSNNINQQNFSMQDLVSLNPSSGSSQTPFRSGGRGRNNAPGSPGNFLAGNQNGIATTHALGLNYSDTWGKENRVKFSGSYFFNASKTNTNSSSTRKYVTSSDSGLVYTEDNRTVAKNYNSRLNLRIEYTIDSSNSLTFTPALSLQHNNTNTSLLAFNLRNNESPESRTSNEQDNKRLGINFSNDLLYQHKFRKKGRTLSANLTTSANTVNANGSLYALNDYYDVVDSSALTDQESEQHTTGYTLSGSLRFTEPIKKNGQLEFNYTPSFTHNQSNKQTYNFDPVSDMHSDTDSSLSNIFNNRYMTQRAGASYRYNKDKLSWSLTLNGQYAQLNSKQQFPQTNTIERRFFNVLPMAMFNFRFSKTQSLRLFYRTSTNAPSVSQLQNVTDNSNTLQLRSGNAGLVQSWQHTLNINYNKNNTEKASNFFVFANLTGIQNYIGNATYIATSDTTIRGIALARGSQLTLPVNLGKYLSTRAFLVYGFPISKLKSNFNLNGGFSFTRIPGLVNDDINRSKNYAMNGGLTWSSNISEKLDFTVSYNAAYNIVQNELQPQSNSNYFSHTASARFNWQFWKGFVVQTNITNTLYRGLGDYNTSFWLWNAALAYKFLKDESLELKFSVNDILNQNTAVSRTVTETYIEDNRYNALQRYYMLTMTYTLRKFGNSTESKPKDFGPPPGNMPPPGH